MRLDSGPVNICDFFECNVFLSLILLLILRGSEANL